MTKFKTMNAALTAVAVSVMSAGSAVALQTAAGQPQTQPPSATTTTTSQTTTTTSQTTTTATPPQLVTKTSYLIGTRVENPEGQTLGHISDIVVDFHNNKVSYCVMSIRHGILGFGNTRYVAVPLGAFQPSPDGAALVLNASRENLARAGFTRGEWPTTITTAWGAQPAAPEALPPVEVFAPPTLPPAPVGYPWLPEPVWGAPPPPKSPERAAVRASDVTHFNYEFGYRLMPE